MAQFPGIGMTHYPLLAGTDEHMAGLLRCAGRYRAYRGGHLTLEETACRGDMRRRKTPIH